jgi:NTE family protein
MGDDMMSRHRLDEVIQQSFLAAGAHSAKPGVAELVRAAAAAGRR